MTRAAGGQKRVARWRVFLAHRWPGVYDGWRVGSAYVGLFDMLIMVSYRVLNGSLLVVWSINIPRLTTGTRSFRVPLPW